MRFSHDRRGQSVVIGTVILFGFLILALSLYQVQVVPQQNAQTEFEHFEEVRNDLVELRAGILQAGSTDRPQYQTVRLGTTYSTRIFAINPPDPAGTIRTEESHNITIAYRNGTVIETIPTRFIQYRPGYNELDRSPTWYDASVLYTDASDDGGGIAVIEGQELVDNDENVTVIAVQKEFRRSGTGRVTVELQPAESFTDDIPDGPLTVTVPTRLSESDWESKTNITEKKAYVGVTDDDNDKIYDLELNTTADNLTVDTVGVGEAPEDATQSESRALAGDDGGNDGSGDPATVVAVGDESLGNKGTIDTRFDLNNSDGSANTIRVYIEDTPGQPLGGDWNQKTVTINGETFELTTEAADDIGLAEGERDLFDATNYENATQSELNDLRDGVTTGSLIENLQQNGSEDLNIRIVER